MKIITGKTLCILMLLLLKSNGQNSEEPDGDLTDTEEIELDKQILNECKTASPPDTNSKWMETLDNNKLISTLTIPGTHDALALHGGKLAECQAWSLENQLKAGIRYFDLRVSGFGLRIMHGVVYQCTSLSEVLSTVRTFLTQYKTEVVLLRVKPSFPMKGKVLNLVQNMIKNDKDIWVKPSIPTIGEVRGKIVFVQKKTFTLGIKLFETDNKGDYKVSKVEDKERRIKQHLEEAAEHCQSTTDSLSLSYSSGTSLGTWFGLLPKKLAKKINPFLYKHLENELKKSPKPCFGIIAMDFPGFKLIEMVIKFNKP